MSLLMLKVPVFDTSPPGPLKTPPELMFLSDPPSFGQRLRDTTFSFGWDIASVSGLTALSFYHCRS